MAEDRSEKSKKPINTFKVRDLLKKLFENIRAAKRNPFFDHCLTLSKFVMVLNLIFNFYFSFTHA